MASRRDDRAETVGRGAPPTDRKGRVVGSVLALSSAGLILLLCLFPTEGEVPSAPRICVLCGEQGTADFVANLLLFLPFGAAVRLATGSMKSAVLTAGALSLGIEIGQIWIPGRHSVLGDVIANTAGAWSGAAFMAHWRGLLFPPSPLRHLVLTGYAVLLVGLFLLPGVLSTPAPLSGELYGNWNPTILHAESYQGRVTAARFGGMEIPSHRIENEGRMQRLWSQGSPIEVSFIIAPPPPDAGPIFRILNSQGIEFLTLGVQRESLLVDFRTYADELRLTSPPHRLEDALRTHRVGDTATARIEVHRDGDGRITLGSTGVGSRSWRLHRGVADLWLFVAGRMTGRAPADPATTLLWAAFLALPLGWYGTRPWRTSMLVAGVLVVLWLADGLLPLIQVQTAIFPGTVLGALAGGLMIRAHVVLGRASRQ